MQLKEYYETNKDGTTQQEWADRFGISRTYFNLLLSGKRTPSHKVMEKISAETGGSVPPESWFDPLPHVAADDHAAEYVEP